jgi:GT2 family glycosyltransferase
VTELVAVVLNFNASTDTIRCVRSLLAVLPQESIVVVDNGSSDGSVDAVRSALAGIDVIETAVNRGYGGGNNVGARAALTQGARHILLLNNDTEVVNPSFISSLLSALEEHPHAGIAGPLVRYPDGAVQPTVSDAPSLRLALRLALARRVGHSSVQPARDAEVAVLNGVCLLIRAETFESTGGFDERYFLYVEEADFATRARAAGWTSLYVPVPSIVHHHPRGDDRGSRASVRVNFVRFCATHRGRASAIGCALLFLLAATARDARHGRLRELPPLLQGLRALASGAPT